MSLDLRELSPELALVDRDLAAAARRRLPEHESFGTPSAARAAAVSSPRKPTPAVKHAAVARRNGGGVAAAGNPQQTIHLKDVRNASYYDLVLWRSGRRVLDVWPTSSRALEPSSLSARGGHHRLLPGATGGSSTRASARRRRSGAGFSPGAGSIVISKRGN
jgi:hypothetical protein